MSNYLGVLRRDDPSREAWLDYQDATGNSYTLLMVMGSAPSGGVSQSMVGTAWNYFATTLGFPTGRSITAVGSVGSPAGATEEFLYLESAS